MQALDKGEPNEPKFLEGLKCALNARLEAGIVPSRNFGVRADESSLLVLDGLAEDLRPSLLQHLTGDSDFDSPSGNLPSDKWTRDTLDVPPSTSTSTDPKPQPMAAHHRTYGPRPDLLRSLQGASVPASVELQRRLCALFPYFDIYFQPSDMIEARRSSSPPASDDDHHADDADEGNGAADVAAISSPPLPPEPPLSKCTAVLANAAVRGDSYRYHVDADPASFPDSAFTESHGRYFNREPHMPLFVSLLVYLNPVWKSEWGAETLFLDSTTGTGIFVVPRPGRAVLCDQDVLHKVTAPSAEAQGRPRFSLVFKLVFVRKDGGRDPSNVSLAAGREDVFGPVTFFGSSARLKEAKRKSLMEGLKKDLELEGVKLDGEEDNAGVTKRPRL